MAKGKEVATVAPTGLSIEQRTQLQELIAKSITEMKSNGEWDEERAVLDILTAESLEDILGSTVIHLRDIPGIPFTITDISLQDSSFEASVLPVFAVINATFDDNTTGVITTGAVTVVAQLVAMHQRKMLPVRVSSMQAETNAGYTVIRLIKPNAGPND